VPETNQNPPIQHESASRIESYARENALQEGAETDSFTEDRYRQFSKVLPANTTSVLDIGCSTGRGGRALASLRPSIRLTGLDCVKARLDALPGCYTQRVCGLSYEIPVEDRTFDAVVAGEFIEHLYPKDVDPTLCEIQRILTIGGRAIFTTPNPYYLKNRLIGQSVYGVAHLTQHFPDVLRMRMRAHGFSNIRISGTGRVSRLIGRHIPLLALYGSYMIRGDKR
jgi:SAM-dependent methyltransferase